MFERFTDRARATVVLAQEEARRLDHNYIGTEHLLLGMLRDPESVAARTLRELGIGLEMVRIDVENLIGRGEETPTGHIPFTPRAKKVLELSLREALQLGHNYIGTEHILLGLVREGEGVAAQVLVKRGAGLERVRRAVLEQVRQQGAERLAPQGRPRRTPGAAQALAAAEELAGSGATGTQHVLEALARSEGSLAAKVLAEFGLDPDTVAAKIDEVGVEGTSDVTPEEVAARQMEVRVEGDEVLIVLRDDASRELVRSVTERLGGPARGDDPTTGGLVGLWQTVLGGLEELRRRVEPPSEPAEEATGRLTIVQRAIESRLRRRRPPKGS
jgi:ATP-dependent Clp protease ATP-binding subunit ClpA